MPSGSIYVPKDAQVTGLSPQVMYETFWIAGRKGRLRMRAAIGGGGFVAGNLLALRLGVVNPFIAGVLLGGLAGGTDFLLAWRAYAATAVWRGKRRGEVRTGRLLRRRLGRHGFRVLDGRAVPGQASIDHLVIGPTGLWIVDNEAWSPDTLIAKYGDKLFFDEKFGTSVAKGLIGAAEPLAALLRQETGIELAIAPILAIHGGKIAVRGGVVSGEGLTVAYPRAVSRWIRVQEDMDLTDEQVELLARTAARILKRPFRPVR
ncbi:NERD domain-containing protein [Streptosporangiaceae bacterium NEAU-GS5]|nr:NERD domain-containing protein [Streptosporangiaceae bacterium NEAU-GS5]